MSYTLLVLCGGEGRRLHGRDKGWLTVDGESFVAATVRNLVAPGSERWRPAVIISANRNLHSYETLGYRVVRDLRPGFNGPLAGIEAGLAALCRVAQARTCQADLLPVIIVPCDMPFLPLDLTVRLLAALDRERTIAVACTRESGRTQPHPLCMAFHARVWRQDLTTFLDQGYRRVQDWLADKPVVHVHFDDTDAFVNVNQPETYSAVSGAG
ncbi:MAG: molybdenum cofactor guanylyltransferase [Pseudohongiellaceae bacterium]